MIDRQTPEISKDIDMYVFSALRGDLHDHFQGSKYIQDFVFFFILTNRSNFVDHSFVVEVLFLCS